MKKFVIEDGGGLRVIILPDGARPITAADEEKLAEIEQARLAREEAYREKLRKSEELQRVRERIAELKRYLERTDYQAIKFAEGEMSESEYAPIKAQRVAWREEINVLERA